MSTDINFTYSRETTIHAFRDYYHFLIHMFMNESQIIEPPEGGWPHISPAFKHYTGKSDSVIDLLRHLPYIDSKVPSNGSPDQHWADWQALARVHLRSLHFRGRIKELYSREGLLAETEPLMEDWADDEPDNQVIPSHVVGLTCGGRESWRFVIDTKLGTIHSEGWDGGDSPWRDVNDPFYVPRVCGIDEDETENELGWRESFAAWPIPDFFRLLKMQYCMLEWIPTTPHQVIDYRATLNDGNGMADELREIYRAHSWSLMEHTLGTDTLYRKKECLEAIKKTIEEKYPEFSTSVF